MARQSRPRTRLGRRARWVAPAAALGLVSLSSLAGQQASAVSAPSLSPQAVAAAHHGVIKTLRQGQSPEKLAEPVTQAEVGSGISDQDTVSNYLKYTSQAAALGVGSPALRWRDRGPFGITMPPGYSQSNERFARVSGMATAVVVDPSDPSGNTVYIGNMGGLWRSFDAGTHWTNVTDGKLPRVSVGAIGLDARHPGDLYVGTGAAFFSLSGDTPGTGIYVSHDRGRTFARPPANVAGYAVKSILVVPSGVLVGTVRGMWASVDRGASFHTSNLPTNAAHTAPAPGPYGTYVTSIVARPNHPTEITAAVAFPFGKHVLAGGLIGAPGNGLYRSFNGVRGPWQYLSGSAGLTNPRASSDPIGLFTLAYGPTVGQGEALWALVADAGLTAGAQPAGLDIVASTTGKSLNQQIPTEFNGLYRSDNDASTWTLKASPDTILGAPNSTIATIAPLGYAPGVQASYNNWVATDPNVPDRVLFGLEEVYQSTANTGATPGPGQFTVIQRYADLCGFQSYFQNVTTGFACPSATPLYGGESTHPDQHAVATVSLGGGKTRLYTGNDGGFFRQDSHPISDGSTGFDNNSWTDLNSISTTEPWHATMLPNGDILAALQDNGVALVGQDGKGVTVSGGDGIFALPSPDPLTFYMTSQGATLYVTNDGGKNMREIQPNLTGASFLSPVAIDPTDPNHLVAAAQDLAETTKGPATVTVFDPVFGVIVTTDWTTTFDAGRSPYKDAAGKVVPWASTALAVRGPAIYSAICATCRGTLSDPRTNHSTVATNVRSGCVAKKQSAACWHIAKGIGLPKVWINAIAIDPRDTRTVYAVANEQNLIGYDQRVVGSARVLVSHDAGDHFIDITGNLPRTNFRGVVVRNNQLIVGGDVGIFTAAAGTNRWSRLATGLPSVRVFDLQIDATGRFITAALYGRGVWTLDFGSRAVHNSAGPGPQGQPPTPAGGPSVIATLIAAHALATWALFALLGALGLRSIRRWRGPVASPVLS